MPLPMVRPLLMLLSALGLLLTLVPAFLVMAGRLSLSQHYGWMLGGTLLWFVTAPFWMNRQGT